MCIYFGVQKLCKFIGEHDKLASIALTSHQVRAILSDIVNSNHVHVCVYMRV